MVGPSWHISRQAIGPAGPDSHMRRVSRIHRMRERVVREGLQVGTVGWLESLPHGLQLLEVGRLGFQDLVESIWLLLSLDVLTRQSVLLAEEQLGIIRKRRLEAGYPEMR